MRHGSYQGMEGKNQGVTHLARQARKRNKEMGVKMQGGQALWLSSVANGSLINFSNDGQIVLLGDWQKGTPHKMKRKTLTLARW